MPSAKKIERLLIGFLYLVIFGVESHGIGYFDVEEKPLANKLLRTIHVIVSNTAAIFTTRIYLHLKVTCKRR